VLVTVMMAACVGIAIAQSSSALIIAKDFRSVVLPI